MSMDPTSEQIAGFAARIEGETPAEPEVVDTPTEEPQDFYLGTYRDRDAAEQGLAEKERMIGELGNRAGEAERRLAEYEAQQQQYQQPTPQPSVVDEGPPSLTQAEILQVNQSIQSLKMEGRTDEALELQFNLSEVLHQRALFEQEQKFEQRIGRLEGPLKQMRGDSAAKAEIEKAKALLGPDADQLMHDNNQVVVGFVNEFGSILEANGTLSPRTAEYLAIQVLGAEQLRQRSGQPPRNERGQFVPVAGGSTAEPTPETTPQPDQLEPGDPRLAFRQQQKADAFGPIPAFPSI